MRALHALLQDHTYTQMPKQVALTTMTLSNIPSTTQLTTAESTAASVVAPQTTSDIIDGNAMKRSMTMDQMHTPVKFTFEPGANTGYMYTFDPNGK